jgi:hypothetical protein
MLRLAMLIREHAKGSLRPYQEQKCLPQTAVAMWEGNIMVHYVVNLTPPIQKVAKRA